MAEVKDKVVTVESLSAVHEYNKNTYMSAANPNGSGTMTINGNGNFSGNLNVSSITIGTKIQLVPVDDRIEIVFLEDEIIEEEVEVDGGTVTDDPIGGVVVPEE